jgi:signal recognition particle GTPase
MLPFVPSQKYVVALQGMSNSGKSKTLKALSSIIKNTNECKNNGDTTTVSEKYGVDFRQIIKWTYNGNNFNLGLATGGDDPEIIESCMEFFKENNCDIIFIPTRAGRGHNKGNTVDTIYNYAHPYGLYSDTPPKKEYILIPFCSGHLDIEFYEEKYEDMAQLIFDMILK